MVDAGHRQRPDKTGDRVKATVTARCADLIASDDTWIHFSDLAARFARVAKTVRATKKQRAQATLKRGRREDRVRAAPAVSCALCAFGKNAHEHTGSAESLRPSLRNGFNGLFRALPGDEFVLSPSSAN